jgi:hypothetical protein
VVAGAKVDGGNVVTGGRGAAAVVAGAEEIAGAGGGAAEQALNINIPARIMARNKPEIFFIEILLITCFSSISILQLPLHIYTLKERKYYKL